MKNRAAKIITVLIAILLIISSVFLYLKYIENKKIAEIKSQFNTKLTDYERDKNLALSYLEIITINSQDKYEEVKEKLYPVLSTDLQNQLFGAKNNTSYQSNEIKYTVVDVKGTFDENNERKEKLFKIQYYTVEKYSTKDYLALIKVVDGLIVSVKTFVI